MADEPRYCEDCRHYEPRGKGAVCAHPRADGLGYVTRETSKPSCFSERTMGNCGHDGKHWEAKDADAD